MLEQFPYVLVIVPSRDFSGIVKHGASDKSVRPRRGGYDGRSLLSFETLSRSSLFVTVVQDFD